MSRLHRALLEEPGEIGAGTALKLGKRRQQEHHSDIDPKYHERAAGQDALDDLGWKAHANAPSLERDSSELF
jgi:hypothetical protein